MNTMFMVRLYFFPGLNAKTYLMCTSSNLISNYFLRTLFTWFKLSHDWKQIDQWTPPSNKSDKREVNFKFIFQNFKKTKYQGGFNPSIYSIKICKWRELITDVVYRNLPKSFTKEIWSVWRKGHPRNAKSLIKLLSVLLSNVGGTSIIT